MADSLLILDTFTYTLESFKYAEAERNYQESLSGVGTQREVSKPKQAHVPASSVPIDDSSSSSLTATVAASGSTGGLSSLAQQVAKAREQIQNSLQNCNKSGSTAPSSLGGVAYDDEEMRAENALLQKKIELLETQVKQLTQRVTVLESSTVAAPAKTVPPPAKVADSKPAEDDDDVDLFGSDEEEDNEEAIKLKEQRVAEYAAKKSKKPALIAKSNVILDVKPWDDETDMKELENAVRSIEMDGLLWGVSKLVPLAYGIKKLQITTVVEDDKVSIEELTEKIEAFEDFIQSVDIAAFNKI